MTPTPGRRSGRNDAGGGAHQTPAAPDSGRRFCDHLLLALVPVATDDRPQRTTNNTSQLHFQAGTNVVTPT